MSDTPRERIRKMMQDADDNNVPAHHRPGLVMSLLRQFGDELAAMTAAKELAERQVSVLAGHIDDYGSCWSCPAKDASDLSALCQLSGEACRKRLAAWSRAQAAKGVQG